MKDISLISSSFNINKTSTYHVSLQLSSSDYSYCIIDTIKKQTVGLRHASFTQNLSEDAFFQNIKTILQSEQYLNKNYKSFDFIYVSRKSVLVPNPIFEKSLLKKYFEFSHVLEENEEIHFNKLKKLEAYNVFTIPSYITTMLVNKYPEIKFFHQSTPLIENMSRILTENKIIIPVTLINFYSNFFDIAIFNNTNLLLYNTFIYNESSDFLYYIINAIQQLGLDPSKSEVIFSGNIDEGSDLHKLIFPYVGNTRFARMNYDVSYSFNEVPEHYFANILDLMQCE